MWQQWVNAILGIWTIIAAYAYLPIGASGRAVLIVTGAVIAILGFWGAAQAPSETSGRFTS